MAIEDFENSEDGWVEWPSFSEENAREQGFDWSLNYEELDKKYNPLRKHKKERVYHNSSFPTHHRKHHHSFRKKPVTVNAKTETPLKVGGKSVTYKGKDCVCVGFIDRPIGMGIKQYQNAYYYSDLSGDEKYIFEVEGHIVAYFKDSIKKFIKPFNNKSPSNTPKEPVDEILSRLLSDPEPNFHYI